MTDSLISLLDAASPLTQAQVAWLQAKQPPDNRSTLERGKTLYKGVLMKFRFTTTPLKDVPLGSVIDGFTLVERSHTGKNAVGWRIKDGKFEKLLLIYTEQEAITEKTA